jgi:signal transduction histidine kinase
VPLRSKWILIMALGVLVPSLVLGAFALFSARAAITAARTETESALVSAYSSGQRLALDSVARRDDATLARAQSLAVATAAFLAHRPFFFPITGVVRASGWQTAPNDPVGIYAPRDYVPDATSQRELASAPYIDAFLEAQDLPADGSLRVVFTTVSGLTWVYPNVEAAFHGALPDLRTFPDLFSLALPGSDPTLAPLWTEPFTDHLDGRQVVAVLTPVMDSSGGFLGVVSVEVALASLLGPVGVGRAAKGTTLLVDASNGQVLMASGAGGPFARLKDLRGLAAARHPAQSGVGTLLGQPTFYAAEGLNGPLLSLWSFVPEAVVASTLAAAGAHIRTAALEELRGVALVWALLIALLLGVALYTADREARRIRALAEGVRHFSRDRSRRLPAGDDELGQLGAEFNSMAEELERLTEHLEEQVAERTARWNRQAEALARLNALGRRLMSLGSRQAIDRAVLQYLRELGYEGAAFATEPSAGTSVAVTPGRLYLTVAGDDPLGILPAVAAEVASALENLRRIALEEERRQEARREAVVAERARLAREIHDTLAQSFLGIVLHARAVVAAGADAQHHLERVMELARKGLEEARRSVLNLSPKALEGMRPKAVLEDAVARWVDLWGIPAETDMEDVEVPSDTTFALLRILQEALENVRKHALASHVRVRLYGDGPFVRLTVQDNGRGFVSSGAGHGLRFMAERAQALGGDVEIRQEEGTLVLAHVPREV